MPDGKIGSLPFLGLAISPETQLYVFGPWGFWNMASLRYTAKFDPFLSSDCARVEGVGYAPKFLKIGPSPKLEPPNEVRRREG